MSALFKIVMCGLLCLGIGQAASIAGSRASTNWAAVNLEERSNGELKAARRALHAARRAYAAGDTAGFVTSVLEIERSVDLAYEFLLVTGESPREADSFKRAEIQLGRLWRRMAYFQRDVSFEDRAVLEAVKARTQLIQHELLTGITSGKALAPSY